MPENELGLPTADIGDPIEFLTTADMEVEGRMPWSSNATFLARCTNTVGVEQRAIYKPVAGERPLWDFPSGLDRRERAAYVVSDFLEIRAVPPTVVRDGPYGEGSVQWFVDADHSEHYFTLTESRPDLTDQFRQIAALDVLINNTDRKSGHLLLAHDRVWAIDNGLCFASEEKLRTVIWEFAGDPIDEHLLERIAALTTDGPEELETLLTADELVALHERAGNLLMVRSLPRDSTGHRYPWPLV